jgi:SAM-dependent methyltransferase
MMLHAQAPAPSKYTLPEGGDRILDFYNKLIGLDQTHFGVWNAGDELNLQNFRSAVERYTQLLASLIPEGVSSIVDAGCGFGGVANTLQQLGYNVTGVTPDSLQISYCESKYPSTKWIQSAFEKLDLGTQKLDLVLMAESCQYLDLELALGQSSRILSQQGYLLVADYFIVDDASSAKTPLGSGHHLGYFLDVTDRNGFNLVKEVDVTERVLPTLDCAASFFEAKHSAVIELAKATIDTASSTSNAARIALSGDGEGNPVWNREIFENYKTYRFFLFQKSSPFSEASFSMPRPTLI